MKDIRIGARMLLKTPLFTIFAAGVLAISIGANITVFSFAKAVFLRPLNIPKAERFVRLYTSEDGRDTRWTTVGDYFQYRDQAQSFADIAAYSENYGWHPLLRTEGEKSHPVDQMRPFLVIGNLFEAVGIGMALGRPLTPEDARPGAPFVAVLSDEGWKRYFAKDPQVLGRTIFLSEGTHTDAFTIVGVAPPAFSDVFYATHENLDLSGLNPNLPKGALMFMPWYRPHPDEIVRLVGRLKPGVTRSAAQADLSRIAAQLSVKGRTTSIQVLPGDMLEPNSWTAAALLIALFLAGVAIVLMIACDNIAIFLLARIAGRRREIGIRLALGATRGQLVRQFIVENLMLSILGGAGAMFVALITARIVERLLLVPMPEASHLTFDWHVLAFATLLSLATTVLFGLRPALEAVHRDVAVSLNPGSRPGDASHSTIRSTLVVTQVTVCTALLITAAVLVRSQKPPESGERASIASHVILADINLDGTSYGRGGANERHPSIQALRFYDELLPRLEATPGIVSASVVEISPIPDGPDQIGGSIAPLRVRSDTGNQEFEVQRNNITPGYFRTVGAILADGRDFTSNDRIDSRPVVIINEVLAQQVWPGENPVGRWLRAADGASAEVVGLARDSKYIAGQKSVPFVYRPLAQQQHVGRHTLLVRGTADATLTTSLLHAKLAEADPNVFVTTRTMEHDIRLVFLPNEIAAYIAGVPGTLAFLLSIIGIYGTIALVVAQRRREIGIRIAVGAHPSQAVALMLKQGMKWTVIGLAAGSCGALILTLALSRYFYGVPPFDSFAFLSSIVVLAATAAIACYVPARQASRLDPLVVLRQD